MSFCYDCSDKGYDMCFCKSIKQPNIKFVSEIDTIKKLQSQLKQKDEELEGYNLCLKDHSKLEDDIEKLENQLKQKDEEIEKVIWILGDYLAGYDPNLKAKEWLEKHKEIK